MAVPPFTDPDHQSHLGKSVTPSHAKDQEKNTLLDFLQINPKTTKGGLVFLKERRPFFLEKTFTEPPYEENSKAEHHQNFLSPRFCLLSNSDSPATIQKTTSPIENLHLHRERIVREEGTLRICLGILGCFRGLVSWWERKFRFKEGYIESCRLRESWKERIFETFKSWEKG